MARRGSSEDSIFVDWYHAKTSSSLLHHWQKCAPPQIDGFNSHQFTICEAFVPPYGAWFGVTKSGSFRRIHLVPGDLVLPDWRSLDLRMWHENCMLSWLFLTCKAWNCSEKTHKKKKRKVHISRTSATNDMELGLAIYIYLLYGYNWYNECPFFYGRHRNPNGVSLRSWTLGIRSIGCIPGITSR